ncbi:ead/Ea22-like family protein [Escherichia coli]|nr:ead/Ea22-like family protein [Escherichia coli]
MSEINYQALREAAERAIPAMERLLMLPVDDDLISEQELKDYGVDIDALNAFKFLTGPETVLALLDERERNQQYIKRRDQENEEIALTVGKLRVELEAAENNLIDSECHVAELEEALRDKQALLEASEKRIAELEAELVSQTYNLPELIEGMEVSIDVSTCDADLGNRYFGTVTEALELDTAKNGYILLVQDAEPNFDINGNSPVTPDGWVIVPKKLTAENGAKGVLSGEFSETTFISCPECFGDDDCETCDGSGRIEIKVPVSWTTIKTIWAKGCECFSIVAPQQDG